MARPKKTTQASKKAAVKTVEKKEVKKEKPSPKQRTVEEMMADGLSLGEIQTEL